MAKTNKKTLEECQSLLDFCATAKSETIFLQKRDYVKYKSQISVPPGYVLVVPPIIVGDTVIFAKRQPAK